MAALLRISFPLAVALAALVLAERAVASALGQAAKPKAAATAARPALYGYKVIRSYPHDRAAYTQGLVYHDGVLYEGTGLNGQSSIRKVRLETGEVLQVRDIDQQYFGEGIVIWKDSLIQLTWQSEIGFVYDRETFAPQRTFSYAGEGWGLTHDGARLVMSDGSA